MITNGGFNGVQMALAHGVPVIGAGKSEDKTLNALLRKQGAIDFPSEEIIRTALPSTVLQTLITKYLRPVSITSG